MVFSDTYIIIIVNIYYNSGFVRHKNIYELVDILKTSNLVCILYFSHVWDWFEAIVLLGPLLFVSNWSEQSYCAALGSFRQNVAATKVIAIYPRSSSI